MNKAAHESCASKADISPQAGPRRLELNVTSDPANLAAVRVACEKFSAEAGLLEQAVAEIGLCVNEAMANITRHAYGGADDRPVNVLIEDLPSPQKPGVQVTLRDWGNGVNPQLLPPKQRDPMQPGGLGLICLRELMDKVEFIPQADGMKLVMEKRRKSAECEEEEKC